jgi:hypothetical protein
MKKLALLAAILVLSACGKTEKVYTVKEFMTDKALREGILQKCKENPGKLGETPNCINADDANHKLFMCREFRLPGQSTGPEACIEKFFGKK